MPHSCSLKLESVTNHVTLKQQGGVMAKLGTNTRNESRLGLCIEGKAVHSESGVHLAQSMEIIYMLETYTVRGPQHSCGSPLKRAVSMPSSLQMAFFF